MTTEAGHLPVSEHLEGQDDWVAVLSRASRPPRLSLVAGPAARASRLEDERSTIVFGGQLYGPRDQGGTEAEQVRQTYERFRESFVNQLNGVFATAVFDRADETFYLARDPLGVQPVFYAEQDGRLLAASSPEALFRQGVSPALSRIALADHICHRWPDPGETYFESVRRLPPGHVLVDRPSARTVRRYWNPAPPDRAVTWVEEHELERFDALMDQAVGRALELGPIGIFLSGGLDSVSVAAVAADRSRRSERPDPVALSLAFPDVESNEETVQRGVAASLGLEQVLLPFDEAVGEGGILAAALKLSSTWPAPLFNIWYPAYYRLALTGAERGCRVIVTGAGGDEWLGVSPFLAADLMRRLDIRGLRELWTMMHRSYRLSRSATLKSVVWRFGAKPIVAGLAERIAPWAISSYRYREAREGTPAWVAPDPALRKRVLARAAATARTPRGAGSFYLREGQISLDHALVSMEMEEVFESSRRTGLPVRMPFWDPDLVDFLYRTPPAMLNEGGRSKGLVRQMLARRFPELGFDSHKKVLATNYFTNLITKEGPSAWEKMGGATALEAAGVIEREHLDSWIKEVFAGNRLRETARVWNLMSLEVWIRGHEEKWGVSR